MTSTDMTHLAKGHDPVIDLDLLTTKEVSAILRCTPATVRRLVKTGKLPAPIKPGGQLRWYKKDIERVLYRVDL